MQNRVAICHTVGITKHISNINGIAINVAIMLLGYL